MPPVSTTSVDVRTPGLLCLAAGLLGAASGMYLAFVEPQVPDTRFSYPLDATGFAVIQVWFVVQHLGLLAGQLALRTSGVAGASRAASAGHLIGLGGMALLTVTELLAITASEAAYPSSRTDVLDALYGVSSIALGVGLTMVGVAVAREHRWVGWQRWLPLTLGVWVFVPMLPALMAGFLPARLAITSWMLLYAALGWALVRGGGATAARP
jgi:hypothetical protein